MKLLPAWQGHIERTPPEPLRERTEPILPKRRTYYSEAVCRLDTPEAAAAFVEFAGQRPLAVVGMDFAFR
jgi:hypothetical protein